MLPALAPILFPTGLPRRGLIAWHDLWFPNILLQSNAFGTTWATTRSAVVESASVYVPGSTTRKAWKLVGNDVLDNYHHVSQSLPTVAGTYTFAVTLKAAEVSWAYTQMYDGINTRACFFDLQNGVVGTPASGTTASMVSLGDGWWRCSITGTVSAVASMSSYVFLAEANNDNKMDGGGSAPYTEADPGIYIADAQLYPSATLPAYAETTTLQSIPDLSGNGNVLTRGSNGSAADTNDPTVLGPGLSFVTDDYAYKGAALVGTSLTWILAFKTDFDSDSYFAALYQDSDTYIRLRKETATSLQAYARGAGGDKYVLWGGATWDESAIDVIALTVPAGGDMTATRMRDRSSKTTSGCQWDGVSLAVHLGGQSAPYANDCYFYSSLLYNRVLTASELQRAYRYLKAMWAARNIQVL